MRRFLLGAVLLGAGFIATAQSDTLTPPSTTPITRMIRPMQTRSKDHLLFQIGAARWQGKPDSINTLGRSRTFNFYLLFDFPFKTSPKLSVALGPGLATDHVFLNEMTADIKANATAVSFRNVTDTNHFKKFKVSTAWLELPVELRFSSRPEMDGKSVKVALGLKVGTLLAAWTKGKDVEDRRDNSINDYIVKEKSKRFFNTVRISSTARLGYGHFSLFGSYSLTSLFKEGVGPDMNAMSIGLTLSGL